MKLAGKNPIYERMRLNPRSIKKIYLQQGFSDATYVRHKAKKLRIPLIEILPGKMQKIGRGKNTQGILADVDDFGYVAFSDLLEQAGKKKRTLVFLDGIMDPQNLGAILRSLGSLGRFSLVIPTHDAVGVTETVLRIASGGENHVPVALVGNLNKAIQEAKEDGYTIVGAVTSDGVSIYDVQLPPRVGLVIGSEQKGIRPGILKSLDVQTTIPMLVASMSLNVASATALYAYEIIRQNEQRKK